MKTKRLTPYEGRVLELEAEGLSTSDAQAVADAEEMQNILPICDLCDTYVKDMMDNEYGVAFGGCGCAGGE